MLSKLKLLSEFIATKQTLNSEFTGSYKKSVMKDSLCKTKAILPFAYFPGRFPLS